MSKNTEKKITGMWWFLIVAIAVACMVFPTGIFYKSAGGNAISFKGLECVFGGQYIDAAHADSKFNIVAFLGFFLPFVASVLYVALARVKGSIFIPMVAFLASFILLFCGKVAFCNVNGLISLPNYSLGVGTLIGALLLIVGFVSTIVVGIKRLVS